MIELQIPQELNGLRLDIALARMLPEHSRTRIKGWIEAGHVQVGRLACKPKDVVSAGARVRVRMSAEPASPAVLPEAIPLKVVHEDRDVLVIDKPVGLVVHPGPGNPRHTLQNALLGWDPRLASLPRAGIIHRLDKDTSGLLMVARTPEAHTVLTRELMARSVSREYLAVCVGVMTSGGTIDQPIGRHRSDRLRMAVRSDGRPATTHYRVLERFRAHSFLSVRLDTGRTHQIRLHLSHLKYPIVGDPVYGGRLGRPRGASEELVESLRTFGHQALHAAKSASITLAPAGSWRFRRRHPRTSWRCSRRCVPMPARRHGRPRRQGLRPLREGLMPIEWLTPCWPAPPSAGALDAARRRGEHRAIRLIEPGWARRGRAGGSGGESAPIANRRGTPGGAGLARSSPWGPDRGLGHSVRGSRPGGIGPRGGWGGDPGARPHLRDS